MVAGFRQTGFEFGIGYVQNRIQLLVAGRRRGCRRPQHRQFILAADIPLRKNADGFASEYGLQRFIHR